MKKVTEADFRMPEYRDALVEDYEFRDDGKLVRKDRWENGIRNIACIVGLNTREFEIEEVIDKCVKIVAATPDCNTLEIISASQSLIDKLHLIILSAEYKSVFVLAGNRGMPYAGPNFELEMNALEMALKA